MDVGSRRTYRRSHIGLDSPVWISDVGLWHYVREVNMTTIWKWIKIIGAFLLMIGAAIVGFFLFSGKKPTKDVEAQIAAVEAIEHKTEADLQRLKELRAEKDRIEHGIQETTDITSGKLDEINNQPDEPKPGDAARSADDMDDAWGN